MRTVLSISLGITAGAAGCASGAALVGALRGWHPLAAVGVLLAVATLAAVTWMGEGAMDAVAGVIAFGTYGPPTAIVGTILLATALRSRRTPSASRLAAAAVGTMDLFGVAWGLLAYLA